MRGRFVTWRSAVSRGKSVGVLGRVSCSNNACFELLWTKWKTVEVQVVGGARTSCPAATAAAAVAAPSTPRLALGRACSRVGLGGVMVSISKFNISEFPIRRQYQYLTLIFGLEIDGIQYIDTESNIWK